MPVTWCVIWFAQFVRCVGVKHRSTVMFGNNRLWCCMGEVEQKVKTNRAAIADHFKVALSGHVGIKIWGIKSHALPKKIQSFFFSKTRVLYKNITVGSF